MRFQKKSITINEKRCFYWEKNAGLQKVAVFLHGFPGSHQGMTDLANSIDGYRLIIPDLPACGQSEPLPGPYTLKEYSDWLDDLFTVLDIKEALIVGHSFGARVALVFSNDHHDKISKAVLITPVVKVEGFIARFVALYYKMAGILPGFLQKIVLSNGFGKTLGDKVIFKSSNIKLRQKIIKGDIVEIKKMRQQVIVDLFNEFYAFRVISVAKENKTSFLVIAGELDEIAPLKSVQELVVGLPRATLEVVKKSGHLVVLERPKIVSNIILNWLA